jgi:SAM-dependent methyltransferase
MDLTLQTKELVKDFLCIKGLWAGKYQCSVCSKKLHRFERLGDEYIELLDKNGFIYSIFALETLNLLKYQCIHCSASDRDRLYALYLRDKLKPSHPEKELRIVEFAPSVLKGFLKAQPGVNYRSADIDGRADDTLDIMDMPIYGTGSIDAFVCSHVLEHVEDDRRALSELYRILKPGGWGICMVPVFLSLEETFESPDLVTPEQRWKYYGQNDHVRAYSKKGFVDRLVDAKFKVEQLGIDHFGAASFEKHGIHPRSVLYVVHK